MAQRQAFAPTPAEQSNLDMTLHEQRKTALDKYKNEQDAYLKLEEEALQRRRDALADSSPGPRAREANSNTGVDSKTFLASNRGRVTAAAGCRPG
jgi:hypothetical protein